VAWPAAAWLGAAAVGLWPVVAWPRPAVARVWLAAAGERGWARPGVAGCHFMWCDGNI
jgi:hypothetical protein